MTKISLSSGHSNEIELQNECYQMQVITITELDVFLGQHILLTLEQHLNKKNVVLTTT